MFGRKDRATGIGGATGDGTVLIAADDTFTDMVRGGVTVVDFSATWCGPCRMFAPVFHRLAGEYAGRARFVTADVDANPRAAAEHGVQAVPTVIVFGPDGVEQARATGALSARQLTQLVESALTDATTGATTGAARS